MSWGQIGPDSGEQAENHGERDTDYGNEPQTTGSEPTDNLPPAGGGREVRTVSAAGEPRNLHGSAHGVQTPAPFTSVQCQPPTQ